MVWKYDLPSFAFIVAGCTIIALLSKVDDTVQTPDLIKSELTSIQTIVLTLMFVLIIVLSLVVMQATMKANTRFEKEMHAWISEKL